MGACAKSAKKYGANVFGVMPNFLGKVEKKLDAGPIISSVKFKIKDTDTAGKIYEKIISLIPLPNLNSLINAYASATDEGSLVPMTMG